MKTTIAKLLNSDKALSSLLEQKLPLLGHVASEETKAKMSASQKANPNNSGRFIKGETR